MDEFTKVQKPLSIPREDLGKKRNREIAKICHESEELKELQQKIRLAYLNKERSAQITEDQYRKQIDLVSIKYYVLLTIYFIDIVKRCSY